jgi:hypothetical protein
MKARAVLDGPPTPPESEAGAFLRDGTPKLCPECLTHLRKGRRGLFCSAACKRAHNHRWARRGAVLAPIFAAARATRDGTRGDVAIGKAASRDANLLEQLWRDEDRAAGRMTAVDYMRLRYRLGYVDVLR